MKLDATVMRTMNREDYRVLASVETGMQSRALVPSAIICSIAKLRHGGTNKILSSLLRDNLLSHDQSCGYDGYRVTNSGYDILALWNLKCRGVVSALGDQIGVGKESDVYVAATPAGQQIVLKFHRLGRTSFRDVKKKRDYFAMDSLKRGKAGRRGVTVTAKDRPNSWLFLSNMSARKEFAFMTALHSAGYATPSPVARNRHLVAMGLVRGAPLYQIRAAQLSADQARDVMDQSLALAARLASNGLVHCDLNEFNLIVDLSGGVQSRSHMHQRTPRDEPSRVGCYTLGGAQPDDVGDHYVRHSGSAASVAGRGRGALTLPHNVPSGSSRDRPLVDGTGELVTERADDEPVQYLPNGVDPKPVVTLIDFPQMISVKHPNAEELWQRDIDCLTRFFTVKLKCHLTEQHCHTIVPPWDDLILHVDQQPALLNVPNDGDDDDHDHDDHDHDDDTIDGTQSVLSVSTTGSIIPDAQLRLDQELQAAGFSNEHAERHAELYYYNHSNPHPDVATPIPEDEDEDQDDQDQSTEEKHHSVPHQQHRSNTDTCDTPVPVVDEYDGAITDDEQDENLNNTSTSTTTIHLSRDPTVKHPTNAHNHNPRDNDTLSVGAQSTMSGLSTVSRLSTMSRAERHQNAQAIARERVRRTLEARKKNKAKRGAFRPKNSNKTFVKGKRVFQDFTV